MTLKEKIKGAIYGMALGDALGLGTEFMTRDEVEANYPGGLRDFDNFVRDAHRVCFRAGEWSNDTEIILRFIDALPTAPSNPVLSFTKKFLEWYNEGPDDIVSVYHAVLPTPGWAENPIVVCHKVWRDKNIVGASNEAINRALLIAVLADREAGVTQWSERLVTLTHDDSRCVVTTAIIAKFIKALLFNEKEPDYDRVREICLNIDDRALSFLQTARNSTLEELELDDEETWWYTRKAMAATMWAHWHCSSPEEILFKIVNAGGDTNTNASAAMLLAGVKYGYDALPPLKEKLLHRERLDRAVDILTDYVIKRHNIKE